MDTKSTPAPETIDILNGTLGGTSSWEPKMGPEMLGFLARLRNEIPEADVQKVQQEAISVLSRCLAPTAATGRQTGLVVGYVQSGKTMSFTAVAALARDNGFRLIIVITGLTTSLFQQSKDRLQDDLKLLTRDDRKWQDLHNPKSRPDVRQRITNAIRSQPASSNTDGKTVLITVMKNRTHLDNLIGLLSGIDLNCVPTLIIDDEADQASLNNQVKRGSQSATYSRIVRLRELAPQHTFLQYTATPQALLLINLIDALSPSFVELLSVGSAYTGGKIFFESQFGLVRSIPASDIPAKDQILIDPPETLLDAMRVFFVGVAAGRMNGARGNRSMMVHPSKATMQHANYAQWVRQIQATWGAVLSLPTTDPDRLELLEAFARAHQDLEKTAQDLPIFQELEPFLQEAVQQTIVTEVNAAGGKTPQIDWHQDYSYILVGGEVLNRGVTIKGLTVTYMPRGKGTGNADTIEQRARWFGYKADYLGYCRVYLDAPIKDLYKKYVDHEESMRKELAVFRATGKPLSEWTRRFFIAPELRPTRSSVLDLEYKRGSFSHRWYEPHAPHDSEEAITQNRKVVDAFLLRLRMDLIQLHPMATDDQHHLVARVTLKCAYEDLLTQLRVTRPSDLQEFTGLLLHIDSYLGRHPDEECTVYLMSHGKLRRRSVDARDSRIPHIWQGPTPARDKFARGEIYPGDTEVKSEAGITIQIHNLTVTSDKNGKEVLAANVPAVTVWMPEDNDADWLAGPGQPRTANK